MIKCKAKEVIYLGYRFRSELEAMWAAFFHALNIDFDYEPVTVQLPNGMKYLPDFRLGPFYANHLGRLSGDNLWAEIKGVNNCNELEGKVPDVTKVRLFSGISDYGYAKNPIIILPGFPHNISEWIDSFVTTFEYVDGDYFQCFISKNSLSDNEIVLCGNDSNYISRENEIITNYGIQKAWSERSSGKFKEASNGRYYN